MLSVDAEQVPTTTDNAATQNEYLSKEHKKEDSSHKEGIYTFLMHKDEFFDAAILYCEKDYDEVNDLMKIIKSQVILENGEVPKIDLFDVISPTGEMFSQMEVLLKRCSCIILYLTAAYLKDSSLIYQSNELLINSVKNQGRSQKNWQLVLITNTPSEVPIGMQSLCMTKWYINRELALRKLKRILQNAQKVRKIKEIENLRRAIPEDLFQFPSLSIDSLSPSPEISLKPVSYHVYNSGVNYNYNVNATNVQIGENAKMYGAALVSPDQLIQENKESSNVQNHNPQIRSVQQNLLPISTPTLRHVQVPHDVKMEDKVNTVCNISEPNVHIPAILVTSTQPDLVSANDSVKDVSNAKEVKEVASEQQVSKDCMVSANDSVKDISNAKEVKEVASEQQVSKDCMVSANDSVKDISNAKEVKEVASEQQVSKDCMVSANDSVKDISNAKEVKEVASEQQASKDSMVSQDLST